MYYLKHLLLALIPGIIIGLCGFVLLQKTGILDGQKPEKLGAYVILSGSMEPQLPVGSVVISQSSPTYEIGDIITFKQEGQGDKLVTHRITQKTTVNGEVIFNTKGDTNEEEDVGVVKQSQVAGKEVLTLPHLGNVVNFAKTPQGFVILIVVPATIVIYEELKTIFNEIKNVFKKILKRVEKREKGTRKSYWRAAVVLPVAGTVFLITALSTAFFTDFDQSLDNILGVSTTYGTTPSPTPIPPPAPSNLVINEFMAQPSEGTDWVEIYNPTTEDIDLTGWLLRDLATSDMKILSGTILAGGFATFEVDGRLNNGGDTIYLYYTITEIDSYTYDSSSEDISIGRETDGDPDFVNCTNVSKGTSNYNQCVVN